MIPGADNELMFWICWACALPESPYCHGRFRGPAGWEFESELPSLDFFCCSKMAVTRRRSKLWWRKAHQSKALDLSYLSSLSKRDLKPSGIHFLKILAPAGILGEPFYKKIQKFGPCGHIRGTLLQNIPKSCFLFLSLAGNWFFTPNPNIKNRNSIFRSREISSRHLRQL